MAHADAVAALVVDPEVLRFTHVPVPPPADFPLRWIERYEQGREEGTREGFAFVDERDGEFLGIGLAVRIEQEESRTVELGYIVAPEARGRGIGAEALRQLTKWALDELGALRVELRIAAENEGSRRVAERAGYVREGVLRSFYFKDGIRQDTEIWSRLPSDPEPLS